MDTCLTRAFLDACQLAKRTLSCLPKLPDWMTPRQVHAIDAIYQLNLLQKSVHPSDVALFLDGTMPSITRMLSELEKHGAIEKRPDATDKRSHVLVLTNYGYELYQTYVNEFHSYLATLFSELDDYDLCVTISTIEKAWELLKNEDFSTKNLKEEHTNP